MSRKIKNIIMIILVVITVILSSLTMNDAKNNRVSQERNDFKGQQFENPLDMQNDENNMSNPPEKPDNISEREQVEDKKMLPNQEQRDNQDFGKMDRPNGERKDSAPEVEEKSNKLQTSYYVLFGIEAFIISVLLIYLCMSKFNQRTFKETFSKFNKIMVYLTLVIILTAVFTYLQGLITKNVFMKNNQDQVLKRNMQMPDDMNLNNKNLSNENKTEQL